MISEEQLVSRVHEFLQSSDLKKTTNNIVIKKLESDFGIDLSDRKPFLRYHVNRFLQSQYEAEEEGEEDDDDGVGGEINRDDHGNDDVSDSDVDGEFNGVVPKVEDTVKINVNGDSKLKEVDQLEPAAASLVHTSRKEKIKRTCFSGKYCTLSPELQSFLGVPHMTRAEVVKQLWTYVKERRLQDPKDGKTIICDETLRGLLEADSINILEINRALTKHIRPKVKRRKKDKLQELEKEEGVKMLLKFKSPKKGREEDSNGAEMKERNERKVLSGFLAPLPLSDTLIRFLGTGETALTRPVVIKRVWDYIKGNRLQDPSDRKIIICDEKLKELLKVDTFLGFSVSKLLTPHLGKMSPLRLQLPSPSEQVPLPSPSEQVTKLQIID